MQNWLRKTLFNVWYFQRPPWDTGISPPELVEFISDTTPIKQGKWSPGAHIPVRPYAEFVARYPDYALLFGWNHAEEIMAKEQAFVAAGGRWIVYVPNVAVIG